MRAEGSEDGTATEGAFFASATDASVSAVTAGAFGERALGVWLAAAITATDFAAAGRADGRSDNGVMAEGIEAGIVLTATEGVIGVGTAFVTDRLGVKPNDAPGKSALFADGNDRLTRIGAAPAFKLPVVPTGDGLIVWARAW